MKPAAAAALTAAVLATAGPARAATPVAGSGSLNSAPVIDPGEYSDTILPGEQLFYAIRLGEGDRLAVKARAGLAADRFRDLVARLSVEPLGPLREPLPLDGTPDIRAAGEEASWRAGPADPASADPFRGPGTWYLSVHAQWGGAQAPPKAEIPFTLAVERAGAAGSTPTPTPSRTAAPAAPRPPRAQAREVDPAAIGAVGMSGLLLGLLGGNLLGRRRR